MRFAMEAQTLNEAIVSVIKALPVRAAMPVLDGIYICADANGVRMKCSDLMLQKECVVPAAVDEPGGMCGQGEDLLRDRPEAPQRKRVCLPGREHPDSALRPEHQPAPVHGV